MMRRHTQGFSLIELIIVIVVLGIMAVGAGMLISRPMQAYSDQLRRQQLVDSAQMAMRKIEADIRRALPNSLRTMPSGSGWALEMVNTVDGARYRDEAGGVFVNPDQILEFSVPGGDASFNLLGRFTSLSAGALPASYRPVIYSTNAVEIYDDAETGANPGIIGPGGMSLALDGGTEHQLTLPSPFQFEFPSPTQRLFIVDGSISYICDNGFVNRYSGYSYKGTQTDSLAVLGAAQRVATQVSACAIDYQPGTAQRGGLITIGITLTDAQGESVRLLHQVHVDNVP